MYTDKPINCRDCGQSFLFTVGEQEFFASKGFTNEPSRCPNCRAANKRNRNEGSYSDGGGYERQERQMFTVVCSSCGKDATVPFQPTGDRPVYCSDCFASQRGDSYVGSGRSRW